MLYKHKSVQLAVESECAKRRRLRAYKTNKTGGHSLATLDVVRTVGEGAFSKVKLVLITNAQGEQCAAALKCLTTREVTLMHALL